MRQQKELCADRAHWVSLLWNHWESRKVLIVEIDEAHNRDVQEDDNDDYDDDNDEISKGGPVGRDQRGIARLLKHDLR